VKRTAADDRETATRRSSTTVQSCAGAWGILIPPTVRNGWNRHLASYKANSFRAGINSAGHRSPVTADVFPWTSAIYFGRCRLYPGPSTHQCPSKAKTILFFAGPYTRTWSSGTQDQLRRGGQHPGSRPPARNLPGQAGYPRPSIPRSMRSKAGRVRRPGHPGWLRARHNAALAQAAPLTRKSPGGKPVRVTATRLGTDLRRIVQGKRAPASAAIRTTVARGMLLEDSASSWTGI